MKQNGFELKLLILEIVIFVFGILLLALCAIVYGPSDSQTPKWYGVGLILAGGLIILPFVVFSGYAGAKRLSKLHQSGLSSSEIRKHNSVVSAIKWLISKFRGA